MADCQACNKDKGENKSVPYIAHEAALARAERMAKDTADRQERTIKRLWVALCLCIIGLIGMFIYETQFVDEQWTSEASAEDGGNAVANLNGEVTYYGEGESNTP